MRRCTPPVRHVVLPQRMNTTSSGWHWQQSFSHQELLLSCGGCQYIRSHTSFKLGSAAAPLLGDVISRAASSCYRLRVCMCTAHSNPSIASTLKTNHVLSSHALLSWAWRLTPPLTVSMAHTLNPTTTNRKCAPQPSHPTMHTFHPDPPAMCRHRGAHMKQQLVQCTETQSPGHTFCSATCYCDILSHLFVHTAWWRAAHKCTCNRNWTGTKLPCLAIQSAVQTKTTIYK